MKRIALVGVGTITGHYARGLADATAVQLCAICDLQEAPVSRAVFSQCPFYRDYRDMIARERPDYVMVSTPPATHYEIAAYALQQGVNVIVEKPAVLSMEAYDSLVSLAEGKGLVFTVAFHWQHGSETECFHKLYDPEQIQSVCVSVFDPYSADGICIDRDKTGLMGAWIDSGVNILSMLRSWLPFREVAVGRVEVQKCARTELPLAVDLQMTVDGVPICIQIDWRQQVNRKYTEMVYAGRRILIDHSLQQIEDGERVISCCRMPRLEQHYHSYFCNFGESPDVNAARDIHRVLFEVERIYEKNHS